MAGFHDIIYSLMQFEAAKIARPFLLWPWNGATGMLDGLSIGLSATPLCRYFMPETSQMQMFYCFIDTSYTLGTSVYVCITPIPNGVLRNGITLK